MALRRTLTYHLFNITKILSPTLNLTLTQLPSTSSSLQNVIPQNLAETTFKREFLTASDSSKNGFFLRFLHKKAIVQSALSTENRSRPIGEKLIEKLKGMNTSRDRLRLDGLSPALARKSDSQEGISVDEARKLLRLSQMEMLKSTLKRIPKGRISYSEFVQICIEGSNSDQGLEFAKVFDESGVVIVLGNVVFLHPEQVAKAIEDVIPLSVVENRSDPRREELGKMEKEKEAIDEKAVTLVRRELWCGLGFLVLQTAGFMRLTFWDLSWDVMEPICFYVSSFYFMAGYTFFLRTSKDPSSFEGLFESRFRSKQKRLMKIRKFDIERFDELRTASHPSESEPPVSSFNSSERTLIYALNH